MSTDWSFRSVCTDSAILKADTPRGKGQAPKGAGLPTAGSEPAPPCAPTRLLLEGLPLGHRGPVWANLTAPYVPEFHGIEFFLKYEVGFA